MHTDYASLAQVYPDLTIQFSDLVYLCLNEESLGFDSVILVSRIVLVSSHSSYYFGEDHFNSYA